MVFSDLFFLFVFIPAFFVCYMIGAGIDKMAHSGDGPAGNAAKNMVLVIFSLVFYAWGEPVYVFLMVASVLLNYAFGLADIGCITQEEFEAKLFSHILHLACKDFQFITFYQDYFYYINTFTLGGSTCGIHHLPGRL